MAVFDIILDSDGELQATGSEFTTGVNDNNVISYIVRANKGEYKEYPLLGVGIEQYLNAPQNKEQIRTSIIRQLKSDVFPNPAVDVSNFPDTIDVDKTTISFED